MNEVLSQEKLSLLEKIKYFFINPRRFYTGGNNKNSWFLLFLLLVMTGSFLQGKTIATFFSTVMNMGGEVEEEAVAIVGKISMLFGLGMGVIGSVITIFLTSLIILLSVKFILKGEITYKQVLSIYCISNIPTIIFNVIILLFYDQVANTVSLTEFMTLFIRKVNFLSIWSLALLIIGISVVSKVSLRKSAALFIVFAFIVLTFNFGSFFISEGMSTEIPKLELPE
ncbi:YIP1 family protein [Sutcliffiella horikoshii]|uniref:Yip1 family protein n=1 Tax=Sutcliffiella horikoshii TaxID=79883 RepID=UPI00384A5C3E